MDTIKLRPVTFAEVCVGEKFWLAGLEYFKLSLVHAKQINAGSFFSAGTYVRIPDNQTVEVA